MKSKLGVLITMALMTATAAYSQVEVDDMYFTSSDRAKLVSAKPVSFATIPQADEAQPVTPTLNASDNYSGRGENPDYNYSLTSGDPQYFSPNYLPTGINQNLSNTYSGYGSPYSNCNCGYGAYGSPYSNFNSPYNNFYSPYSSFYSPYSMMGYGYGMGSMYGMGSPYGYGGYGGYGSMFSMGYGYGSPFMSYGMSFGSPYYGYGYGGYGYGYGYGGSVITDGNSGVAYGKRASRSNGLNNPVNYTRNPSANASSLTRTNSSGRVSNQSQYYQRGWRSNPSTAPASNTSSRSWLNSGGTSNPSSSGGRSWSNSNSNSGWGGGSRSSSGSSGGSSFSGGGFSGGGHSGGGGGGGRGRH